MLKQAYLARKVSEESFASLDDSFSHYQNVHPRTTSYRHSLSSSVSESEVKEIALHFATAGYDVSSDSSTELIISWTNAKEGWTGAININNSICFFNQAAKEIEE